ncbi:MAG: hypothetical protein J6T55_00805 [Alphaproteobacteria bacterium]|nr:hypothetical protein [Alphaproteobacteria bacterium]
MKELFKRSPIWTVLLCLLGVLFSCVLFDYGKVANGIIVFPLFVFLGLLLIDSVKKSRFSSQHSVFITDGHSYFRRHRIKGDDSSILTIPIGILIILGGLFYIMGPSDSEFEQFHEKQILKACSEEQIFKTGLEGCKQKKEELKKWYTETPLRKINSEWKELGYPAIVKKLEKEVGQKCSEKGLKQYGSLGCENVKKEFQQKKERADYLKGEKDRIEKRIKELEKT